jgi:hypothetical protein
VDSKHTHSKIAADNLRRTCGENSELNIFEQDYLLLMPTFALPLTVHIRLPTRIWCDERGRSSADESAHMKHQSISNKRSDARGPEDITKRDFVARVLLQHQRLPISGNVPPLILTAAPQSSLTGTTTSDYCVRGKLYQPTNLPTCCTCEADHSVKVIHNAVKELRYQYAVRIML